MLEKSQEYLRLAMAAAALLIGVSIAYHYVIYVPEQDRAEKEEKAAKATKLAQITEVKDKAAEKSALSRRTNYKICVSTADYGYHARWDGLCRKKSEEADKGRAECVAKGYAEDNCRSYFPPLPSSDCLLPRETSENYDAMLKEEKKQCLEEARSGILDTQGAINASE